MKKKIVIIVESMLGGIRQHICDVVQNLDKNKYDIYIIYSVLRADTSFKEIRSQLSDRVKLIQCNEMQRSLGIKDIIAYKTIVKIIKDIRPNIVHCHSSKAGFIGRLAAKKCGVSLIIYTPHAYAFQSPDVSIIKKKIYIYAERFLSRYATSLTVNVSKGEMQLAQKYQIDKPEKFTLIYNGIPQIELKQKNQIRRELGLNENTYYVGVTARCAKQKDPFTFLKIAEKVVQKNPKIEFIYIGNGEMQKAMNQWISENKMGQKIHMIGFRTDAAIIVGAFDLYLSTALYEGLPYSMIEAMRAGVPIIASDTVGNNELVFEGINGQLFPVRDVEKACDLILDQYKNHNIKPQKVKDTFAKEFSIEIMMNKLNKILENT